VLPILISYAIDASTSGADAFLRVREMGGRIAAATLSSSVVRIVAVLVLAATDGLRGAAWGLVVGSTFSAVAYWCQVLVTSSREGAQPERPSVLTAQRATT
jgi:O-antigen/teichoic acid export membrane protein